MQGEGLCPLPKSKRNSLREDTEVLPYGKFCGVWNGAGSLSEGVSIPWAIREIVHLIHRLRRIPFP